MTHDRLFGFLWGTLFGGVVGMAIALNEPALLLLAIIPAGGCLAFAKE